ncbi:hypothetical protein E0H70_28095 [Rhizobium leguminosarum bv. viciae]|nr:hypothetical protein E0H70_28095 [Rhizobium leguminosarum bv. viciae]
MVDSLRATNQVLKGPRVKTVDFSISVKRTCQGQRPNIVSLVSVVPGLVVLGGEPDFAVDVAVPADREARLRALVKDTCDIEGAWEFHFLNGMNG